MSQRPSVQFVGSRDLGPRDWGNEILLIETQEYLAKRLDMKAGTAGGLQYHRRKVESFLLASGSAIVEYEGPQPCSIASRMLTPGAMVHVPAGAVHRVKAITDCVFYEWSTPIFDDRVRVEKEFGEEEKGGLPTTG